MRVVVNGNEQTIEPGMTVAALIAQYEFQPKQVAVEINRDLVPRRAFDSTELKDGDEIEVVTLVGGG
jgi:thiamine biosynthesis protein ThiS